MAFCAVAAFATGPALALDVCRGASGVYAEDLGPALTKLKNANLDRKTVERLAASLPLWLKANERIGKAAGFTNRLVVCNLPGVNAFVTTRDEPVRIHVDAIAVLGTDEEIIAALLGHEYSHLALNHRAEMIAAEQALRSRAGMAYQRVFENTMDAGRAKAAAVAIYRGQLSRFSINNELAADDYGISLLGKAGYKPTAFLSLATTVMALGEKGKQDPFPSHPGFITRMRKGNDRATDVVYDQTAARLLVGSDYDSLTDLVGDWLSLLPNSGNAWYYKAMLLRQRHSGKALEALEMALTANAPSLRLEGGEPKDAWLWLCVELYKEGYGIESAWCGETFLRQNARLWAEFQKRTFRDRMLIGANGRNETIGLNFVRRADGGKLITNNASSALERGVAPGQQTPPWRPIRYQGCDAGQAQCRQLQGEPDTRLSAPTRSEDPFADLRAECKPPLCRVTQ